VAFENWALAHLVPELPGHQLEMWML